LTELELETYRAIKTGFSTNLVVHAFAHTARTTGFDREIIEPFFHSMRLDLTEQTYDQAGFETYVYGSAEVVGLMCLQAFIWHREQRVGAYSAAERETLVRGARALGSAFQKVNFLRDLAADFKALGRSYFPNVNVENFNESEKQRLVADIAADLAVSSQSLTLLPQEARRAVAAAQMLFEALNARIAKTSAAKLIETRIRVANPVKFWILLKALIGVIPK
jgi:phytoene/squalene synthetase